jgi:uncharacterized protein YecT (DUF1311 family)
MKRGAFAIILLLVAAPAMAQDDPKPDCANPITQLDMNLCAAKDFEAADAELNTVWKKARAVAHALDEQESETYLKGAANSLLAAQRGWIAYRDGHCALAGWEMHGGSAEPMLISGCRESVTRERIKQLNEFVTNQQP